MKTLANLIFCSVFLTAVTSAQWSTDPASPQLLGSGVQAQLKATTDGGVYVAWLTDMGGYHVYLQRLDATGLAQFDDGGMLVSDHNNESWIAVFHMNLAVDSDNNAIITVLDKRAGPWNVYAYKIAPDGSMLWGDDGVSVSNSSQTNYSPRLAVLPDNSVVVAWSPNSTTVEIQRISSDGGLMWGDGILIEDSNESLMSPQPIVNSNGDALVQWIGQSGPIWAADSKIYLQKYDLDGNTQWDNPAVAVGPVVFPMGNWSQQLVAEAGSGSFSAWTQFSGNVQNAVSQHITAEGAIAWTGGVDLSTNSSNFRMSPMLFVAEETQELMAVWTEANGSQSQRGIFAQRLDSSGNQLWGSNGVTVVALNSSYDYLDLSVVGFGEELISAYIQQSANMDGDIYANRLDAEGNLLWTDETVTVTNTGTAKSDMMAGKGMNCLFIAWTENGSVYAHCLREDGTLGAPDLSGGPGDVLLVPSEYATIQDAIDASEDRDTILVAPGTYTENINFNGKNIVVGSYYMTYGIDYFIEQTVIDGDSSGSVVTFENGEDSTTILTGFTIQNGVAEEGGGILCISSGPNLSNLIIKNNFTTSNGGGIQFRNATSNMTYLELIENETEGYHGGGLYITDSSSITMDYTLIAGNNAIYWDGGGFTIDGNSTINMNHCIMSSNRVSNGRYGGAIEVRDSLTTVNIINSILYRNWKGTNPQDIFAQGILEIYNSCLQNIHYSEHFYDSWIDENNIYENPQFCFPGDFTIAQTSPCAGTASDGLNIGAFEIGCEEAFIYDGPVWYVSMNGSDLFGVGSLDFPLRTIQFASNVSEDGDTIAVSPGLYNEHISVGDRQLTICSFLMFEPGQRDYIELTILDGDSSQQIFSIGGSNIEIFGLTLQNGYSTSWGGAIGIGSYSDVIIKHSVIKNGYAEQGGGGINSNRSHLTLDNVVFLENSSQGTGAINAGSTDDYFTANITISNSKFITNKSIAGNSGAAKLGWGSSVIEVHKSEFISNHANGYGGLRIENDFVIDSCLFIDNTATNYGAGGGISTGTGVLSNSIFINNSIDSLEVNGASNGGGFTLWSDDVEVDVVNCTFVNNIANTGGGLSVGNGAEANVINSIFYNNYPDQLSLEQWNDHCASLSVDYSLVQSAADSIHFDTTSCELNWGENNINVDPIFCDPESGDFSLAEGSPCIGTGHDGANMGALGIGCDALSNGENPSITPISFVLHQNYPNPFNPVTTLRYDLPEDGLVNITIYDMMGRVVSNLVSSQQNAGYKSIQWNATNNIGQPVSAGLYLYTIEAGDFRQTKKMLLLK